MGKDKVKLSYAERRALVDSKMVKHKITETIAVMSIDWLNDSSPDDVIAQMSRFNEAGSQHENLHLTISPSLYGSSRVICVGTREESNDEFEARKDKAARGQSKKIAQAEALREKELAELDRLKAKYGE